MSHLNHDEFVLSYYAEPGLGTDRAEHLATCEACRGELARLAAVLDRVTPAEVPEPAEDYEARTWDRLQWRMRGERKRAAWPKWIAAAAVVALAFVTGLLWQRSSGVVEPSRVASTTTASTSVPAPAAPATTNPAATVVDSPARRLENSTRVLLVVVGEHMDESERILVELTNLPADGDTDITAERERAADLVASNRLYRASALERGEESVATLLDELEPVLLQIAHADSSLSADELRRIQKRVEAKGLVFKLRVVRADVNRDARTPSTNI
jgi:hypothetical protein